MKFSLKLVCAAVLASSLVGASANAITLRIGHNAPAEDPRTWAAEQFAKHVDELSSGEIKAKIFPSGQLGDTKEMLEGLKMRTLDIFMDDIGTLGVYGDVPNLAWVPFLYRDEKHYFGVMQSDLGRKILDQVEQETGYKPLGFMYRGGRDISSVKPIKTAEDFKGLKIRVPSSPIMIEGFKKMGASPVAMAFTEVFGSLQRKVIDAQENPIDLIYTSSLYEVSPYIVISEHVYGAYNFIMFGKRFDSLSKEEQEIVNKAADMVSKEYNERVTAMLQEKLEQLKSKEGVDVFVLSGEDKAKLAAGMDEVINENYPSIMPLVKEIRAFK